MKKVNWGILAVATTLCAITVWMVVDVVHQLIALGEINENLMGRTYDMPDEY